MDYSSYNVDEFVLDEKFQDWVLHPSEERNRFWLRWMKAHPAKNDTITEARRIISALKFEEHFPSERQTEISLYHLLQEIDEEIRRSRLKRYKWLMGIAAAILALYIGYELYKHIGNPNNLSVMAKNETASSRAGDNPEMILNPALPVNYEGKTIHKNFRFGRKQPVNTRYGDREFFRSTCIKP